MHRFFKARRESITLALMLESLHAAMWVDLGSPLSRSFMLMHLGVFLIWQPVWRGDEKLAWYNGLLFILLMVALVTWMNWWLMVAWLILLVGFCGGRLAVNRQQWAVYMLMLVFLVLELLFRGTPMLFQVSLSPGAITQIVVLLPALPLVIALLPTPPGERTLGAVDYLHAIATATLVTLLIVGGLLNMYRTGTEYLEALLKTLMVIAAFLFIISWLLTPRMGFSGLSQLWLRAVLNIGTPFERWLTALSDLFRQRSSPGEFLEAAMEELAALPWIAGVEWQSRQFSGERGQKTRHRSDFTIGPLTIAIFSRTPLGGGLYLHCKLLTQVIGHFFVAKLQEGELTKRTHLQAIYETGARVTHDIKNILQSLQAITSIIINEDPESSSVSQRLVRRQLPHLTQRLQLALDKLQAPGKTKPEAAYLKDWWQDLRTRTNDPRIAYHADIVGDPIIPADLFDSVVENLLENLREKQQIEPEVQATVTVASTAERIHLRFCDSGSAIPEDRAQLLLQEPMPSETGLGIGLYQAARQAEALGYTLSISSNETGRVCFELQGNALQEAVQEAAEPG
jgi:signal transduction histidine kinase